MRAGHLPAPGCKENKQLRGRAVNAALAVELALTLAMCMGQDTKMVLLNMTPTLRIEMNVDMTGCIFAVLMSTMWLLSSVFAREYMGHDATSACIRCSSWACSPR